MAIGERSQSAKTYLEGEFATFENANRGELIMHALKALKSAAHDDTPLSSENTSIAIVGVDEPFTVIEGKDVEPLLKQLK
mmetsp:Transcript_6370/g.7299  ORF Transcript_6370/g.7299 Transcript_6370/m.7299 type:complete len:80 (+) Transcript_6370:27-266(+)